MIKKLSANDRRPQGLWGNLMIKKMNRGHAAMTKWGLENIPLHTGAVVADIGCGGGNAVFLLSKIIRQGKIYGVDYAQLCIEQAIRKNRREIKREKVKILKAGVSSLPFQSNTLDLVTAIETIYFWPDLPEDFQEIRRVLKKGGRFAILCEMVKNEDGSGKHTEIADFLKLHYLTKNEIATLLKNAGFSDIRLTTHTENGWLLATASK